MNNKFVGIFVACLGTLVPMFGLNALFHGVLMAKTFDEQLAGLTIPMGQPNLPWLILADVILAATFVYFATTQKDPRDLKRNAMNGAILCLVASGTWNFVNMGVMSGWPIPLMFIDIGWHVVLGAFCGVCTGLCLRKFGPRAHSTMDTSYRRAS